MPGADAVTVSVYVVDGVPPPDPPPPEPPEPPLPPLLAFVLQPSAPPTRRAEHNAATACRLRTSHEPGQKQGKQQARASATCQGSRLRTPAVASGGVITEMVADVATPAGTCRLAGFTVHVEPAGAPVQLIATTPAVPPIGVTRTV
jgi:hypothetical protein